MIAKLAVFLISWVVFFAIDMFWIRVLMKSFYSTEMKTFFRYDMHLSHQVLGFLIWGILTFGLIYFVEPFSVSLTAATVLGAAFGFVVYGVYDLTNYVVINNWSLKLVLVDLAWGCFVNALMANFILVLRIYIERFL